MRILLLLAALIPAALAQQPAAPPPPAANPATKPPQNPPIQNAPAAGPAPHLMSPSDAYDYAMQPFTNARSSPNDLTEADQWALGIGVARARESCEALMKEKLQGEDLLALGKLCIFGQDFEPARRALIDYLALPQPKSPELDRLLLTRAFLGLHSTASAESQLESLLSLYPYDASIHLGIDMAVDTAAASDSVDDLLVIGRLNEQQIPHILDALAHGGTVPASNGDTVDSALLVCDALRIADALRRSSRQADADKILAQVKTDIEAPAILNSAFYPAIHNAVTRYELYLQRSPVRSFHAVTLPASGPLVPHVLALYDPDPAAHRIVRSSGDHTTIRTTDDRTLVLVFSLAGPSSSPAIQHIVNDLAKDHITPGLKVVAVTSWAANIGVDAPTPELLATIRGLRASLPASLPVYVVPDPELKPFAIDMWPAAILFDGRGRIVWLNTVSGSNGSIRQMEREIEPTRPMRPR